VDLAVVVMSGLFTVQAIAGALRYRFFTLAGERIVADLRARLYEKVIAQDMAFFDRQRTGELLSRLSSDTQLVQNAVSVNLSMALRSAVGALGSVALLFVISIELTLWMLAVVPPVALGAVIYGRMVRRYSKRAQDALARASEVAEESIGAIRTVRSFAAEVRTMEHYRARVEDAFDAGRRRVMAVAVFVGVTSFSGFVAITFVLWRGGHQVLDGELTAGQLTSFILYSVIVAFSLGTLTDLWSDFMRATGAAERVFQLMDAEPEIEVSTGDRRLSTVTGRVRFEGVRFRYPTRPDVDVLRGVDFALEPGSTLAVVGPSGAGKSTLVQLMLRAYDPSGGQITIDGADLRQLDLTWWRRQVGVVAQEPILFSTTLAENIRFGRPEATDAEVRSAAAEALVTPFVADFPEGFETRVGERGVQLSGGQRQRVAIARALLADPRVLVLDEATSALDAEAEALVKRALDRLREGRTTLVIAHRLSTVKDADRVLVLDGGEVVETGSHAELMRDEAGLYRRLVEHQLAMAEG
jgi:ATP-binding cassette subfamily B protein